MKNLSLMLLSLVFIIGCSGERKEGHEGHGLHDKKIKKNEYYTCSMHPQIREDRPGKCPICSMGLTKVVHENEEHSEVASQKPIYYCEVDASVTSEAPGECPLDGTPLKLKKVFKKVARVKLRTSQVEHFRASLFEVKKMKMKKKIRLLGTLLKSEEGESNIPARVGGRVEEVFVQSTGSFIRVGDPVIKLYSSQLLTGGEEYLIARKNYLANRGNREFKDLYQQSIQRMKLWGVLNRQLEAWANKGKVPREITIYSPVTGIVEKKHAIQGKYFKEGQSFFDLVDLSSLWLEMDVYEHDSALVTLGQKVDLEFSAYPGELWQGKIDFINPVLDEKTRTLKVRTTLDNIEGKLRPGMAAVASITVELKGEPIVVPRTAVIDTGKRKLVWLDQGNHHYIAREIHTGFESEGHIEVKDGLELGEQVVVAGNFLLDAQAHLFGGYTKDEK